MATIDGITEWFTCDCCSHLISVTDLNSMSDPVPYIEIDLWSHPGAQRTDLGSRLRAAWQALRGQLYRDFIVLDFPTAQRLGQHLLAASAPTHGWGCPKDGETRKGDCADCRRAEKEIEGMQNGTGARSTDTEGAPT